MTSAPIDGRTMLYSGLFNTMSQEWMDDGSVVVTLSSQRGNGEIRMHMTDLYGPDEDVHVEVFVPVRVPPHIAGRQAEASAASVNLIPSPDGP